MSKVYYHPDSITLRLDDLNNSAYYAEANKLLDESNWREFYDSYSFKNVIDIRVRIAPALAYISEHVNDVDILIINENHAFPYQRRFASQIALKLYSAGFNHLGLEALCKDRIISRSQPLCYTDGIYTKEPEFGSFIATAQSLGYKTFGYENCESKSGLSRDEAMVENILSEWNRSDGKLILYCGWSHSMYKEGWMANIFKNRTNYKILSVNQTTLNPRMPSKVQDSIRDKILNGPIIQPSVLLTTDGRPQTLEATYDLEVIYPIDSWGPYIGTNSDLDKEDIIRGESQLIYLGWKDYEGSYNNSTCLASPVMVIDSKSLQKSKELLRNYFVIQ